MRALASELGVNRTTVMNAYNELASEGLIEGHVGRGTLVRRNSFLSEGDSFEHDIASWLLGLPAGEREILGPDALLLSELASMSERKEIISLAAGTPAPDLLPAEMLNTIFADALLEAVESAQPQRITRTSRLLPPRGGCRTRLRRRQRRGWR